ncbi:MAG: DUF2934 domain-containing protein [Candidatus Omnitrophota bacterium]
MVRKIIKKIKENSEKKATSTKTDRKKTVLKAGNRTFKTTDTQKLLSLIEKEAYVLYLNRGGAHGSDQEDWYIAETRVRKNLGKK